MYIYIYIGISVPHSLQVAAWGGSDLLAIQDIHVLYSIPKNCWSLNHFEPYSNQQLHSMKLKWFKEASEKDCWLHLPTSMFQSIKWIDFCRSRLCKNPAFVKQKNEHLGKFLPKASVTLMTLVDKLGGQQRSPKFSHPRWLPGFPLGRLAFYTATSVYKMTPSYVILLGGWTTHLKNMIVKMGSSSPIFGENKKCVRCHHPVFILFMEWCPHRSGIFIECS